MGILKLNDTGIKKLTDNELVNRIISGEKELFEILMRRNNQKLYRIIRGYIVNEEEVLDVMQETYLKAFHKLDGFKQDSMFSTWLIRIGINESLQWLRKSKRIVTMEDDKIKHLNESLPSGKESSTPESKTISSDINQLITSALDSIPEKYRVIFIMSEVENMSQAEIAESLDLTHSNVKVRLHRAKALIKDELFKISKCNTILEFGNSKCDMVVNNVMNSI